ATAARAAPEAADRADAAALVSAWEDIAARAAESPAPSVIHGDVDLLLRLLREAPGTGFERVVVDTTEAHDRAAGYLRDLGLATKLVLHEGGSLFEEQGVDEAVQHARRARR